jgi:predicted small secreted protein
VQQTKLQHLCHLPLLTALIRRVPSREIFAATGNFFANPGGIPRGWWAGELWHVKCILVRTYRRFMKAVLLTALLGFGLGGCNTTQGFGEDVKAAGDAIEDTAEEAEDRLDD